MSNIKYFVEGECEEALLRAFMSDTRHSFKLGKINVLNLNNESITKSFALSLSPKTELVIILDTDVSSTKILENNLATILKYSSLNKEQIHIVMSVKTLEDEIVYASSRLNKINQLFDTESISEFKKKFITRRDLEKKLEEVGFDIKKIWIRKASKPFDKFINEGNYIKNI